MRDTGGMQRKVCLKVYGAAEARGAGDLNESELYRELGILTKDRTRWKESIPYVSSLLSHESVKIQAKALWLLGEICSGLLLMRTRRSG